MLTEPGIRSALKNLLTSGKRSLALKDPGTRGEGRLALIVRTGRNRLTTEWYIIWYEGGKRAMSKIGSYPIMSLAEARRTFREGYRPKIMAAVTPVKRRPKVPWSLASQDLHREQQATPAGTSVAAAKSHSTEARRHASERFHLKRRANGMAKATFWLSEEARNLLTSLAKDFGSQDLVVENAIKFLAASHVPRS